MVSKSVKQAIKSCDLFSQSPTFRFGDQPEYQSLTGGFCSIIICIAFMVIFVTTAISTFQRDSIDYKTTIVQEQDPTFYQVASNSFIFAIGITGVNLNQGDRWFEVYFEKRIYQGSNKTRKSIPLQPCQKSQWTRVKKELGPVYDRLGFSAWLCPREDLKIQLQGKYSSDMFKHYKIAVKKCKTSTNQTRACVSNSTIESFLNANQTFTFNFYYVNTIINPGNLQFTENYLDDLNYFPFTPFDGISANFFISAYQIKTDQSLYPYQNFTYKAGGVSTASTQTINYKVRQADYLKFYIRKSSLSMKIERSFRKIDDSLSYVGGLFSILLSILIIMNKYNEYSYQIEMAKNLFHYEKHQPIKSDQFNFFVFLGFVFYYSLTKIKIRLPWERMEMYQRSLEEVRKQMDIRLVMKKILYSQRMAIAVFDEPKAKMLHLQQPLTLSQAQQIRKDHRFYQKLEAKYFDYQKIKKEQNQENQIINKSGGFIIRGSGLMSNEENNFSQPAQPTSPASNRYKESEIDYEMYQSKFKKRKAKRNSRKKTLREIYQSQKMEQYEKQVVKRKFLHLSHIFVDEQKQKQIELQSQLEKMKEYASILLKEAQNGDEVSEKILNRFDPKLMKLILAKNQNQEEAQTNKYMPEIEPCQKQENFQVSNINIQVKNVQKYQMKVRNKSKKSKMAPLSWSLPPIKKN